MREKGIRNKQEGGGESDSKKADVGDGQRAWCGKTPGREIKVATKSEERWKNEELRRKKTERTNCACIKLHPHAPCGIAAAFEHCGKFVAARATRFALLSWASTLGHCTAETRDGALVLGADDVTNSDLQVIRPELGHGIHHRVVSVANDF